MKKTIRTIGASIADSQAENLARYICFQARGPFKTYGKQAFTPEVPPQVLVNGKLYNLVLATNGVDITAESVADAEYYRQFHQH
jgi:hypothetical protein